MTGLMSTEEGRTESLFDLYASIYHLGALSGGHYIASIKSQANGKWHFFNDSQVQEINESELESPSAYILFYVRRFASWQFISLYLTAAFAGICSLSALMTSTLRMREVLELV